MRRRIACGTTRLLAAAAFVTVCLPRGAAAQQPRFTEPSDGDLTGAQVVPPSGSPASGYTVSWRFDGASILVTAEFSGLGSNATAVHVHSAAAGANGPVLFTMFLNGTTAGDATFNHGPSAGELANGPVINAWSAAPGSDWGGYVSFPLGPGQAAQLISGQFYFNVPSTTYPSGELRGQFKPPNRVTDFDADARAEVGVFRPSSGTWFTLNPGTNAFTARQFGISTDKLAPGDYDGDGRTDHAVWRSGTFWILDSSTGAARGRAFGAANDDPSVSANYDGDLRADMAVYRRGAPGPSFFYHLQSTDDGFRAMQFGNSDDTSITGDYDGDRKSDIAVYRETTSTHYVSRSTLGFQAQPFGVFATDLLTPGDYDGDGKTDLAVHRINGNGTRTWYFNRSSNGALGAFVFGVDTDIPLQSYLIR
jgi:hypothetical protein